MTSAWKDLARRIRASNERLCEMTSPFRLYLSGAMRGIYEFNFPAFDDMAAELRSSGFEVFNPAERERAMGFLPYGLKGTDEELKAANFDLRSAFAADCEYLCKHADGIWMLPGWKKSQGANVEYAIAKLLGLTILGADE